MKKHHRIIGYIFLVFIIILFLSIFYFTPGLKQFSSPEYVRDFLVSLGNWGQLVFIFILMLTIPLPIPSTPVVLGGGYVYGTILGTVLALIACVIGSSIAFLLVRKFGRPLLENLVDKYHIKQFSTAFKRRGLIVAFISYALPLFPSDAISLILGLTKIRFRTFLALLILGHIPRYLILNSFGADLHSGFTTKTIIIIIFAIIFLLIAIFREPLKKFFFKELKEVEKEVEKIEEEVEYIEKGLGIKKKKEKKKRKL